MAEKDPAQTATTARSERWARIAPRGNARERGIVRPYPRPPSTSRYGKAAARIRRPPDARDRLPAHDCAERTEV